MTDNPYPDGSGMKLNMGRNTMLTHRPKKGAAPPMPADDPSPPVDDEDAS